MFSRGIFVTELMKVRTLKGCKTATSCEVNKEGHAERRVKIKKWEDRKERNQKVEQTCEGVVASITRQAAFEHSMNHQCT